MLDIITLKGLTASGTHGVYEFEQREKQPFVVDVSMWVDICQACATDDIDLTVSYADIAQDVSAIIEGPSVRLIETLAGSIAARVLDRPRVRGVEVTVHKPHAPLSCTFEDVCVRVRRGEFGGESFLPADEPPAAPAEGGVWGTVEVEPAQPTVEADERPVLEDVAEDTSAADVELAGVASADVPLEGGGVSAPGGGAPVFLSRRQRWDAEGVGAAHSEDECTPFVLVFGGNQGNVPLTLSQALERLIDARGVDISAVSPLLRTHAVLKPGMEAQPDHWNAVVLGTTTLAPYDFLDLTSSIESELGRERPFDWAPRTIDIDIITMGEHLIDEPDLQLPHPRAAGRAFVLIPWFLVDPDAVLPGVGPIADLIPLAADKDGVVDAVEDWFVDPDTLLDDSDALLHASIHAAPPSSAAPAAPPWENLQEAPVTPSRPARETVTGVAPGTTAAPAPAEPTVAAPASTGAAPLTEVPSFSEALIEEKLYASKPHIPWKPVNETAAPVDGKEASDLHAERTEPPFVPLQLESLADEETVTAPDVSPEHLRPLPEWNFSRSEVTIIDSTGDEHQDLMRSVAPTEDPNSRTILDPDLPEGTPVGPAPSFPTTATGGIPARRHTMRPTHTGMIPVVKRTPPSS